ncbi:thiolase family protein [Microbispora triticiradicis]|uniref:Probable acetyl-CoA acetyltransferase n=1 Tax=Microbispora triticiradicis TaxID=2200763 RepID=A0ABX9LFJ6_9ACTN|nr:MULTISPECIES: thiolase family protein [Microbispora]RGA02745.1 thiolase family protein [Microbispora triticiradicis]GLW25948.1 acetyl-CoA acetyltransferase [Microbispora amethystogenes]
MKDVFIADAVRTPIGRYGGALAGIRPDDLAAGVIGALLDRAPGLDPERIDDVVLGAANGAGEDNRNVGRMAALLAGLPVTVPGSTVNRLCASGLEAVIQAARAVACGDASVVVAGGVESMSRAPWVLPKPERGFPRGHEQLYSTTLGWRMVNPEMPERWTVSLGEATETLARRRGVSREEQDAFAERSHRRAAAAWRDGLFDAEIVPREGLSRDETIRDDTSAEALARLKPAFAADGTITAGNSSPLNDGAAALLVTDADGLAAHGLRPLARVVSTGVAGVDPADFGIGPVPAVARALGRAGLGLADLASVELNEAFAAQVLACLGEWKELDPEVVNPQGGAIAIGHPLGCSGARLAGTLAHRLSRTGGYGVATLCVGVGQGLALTLEGLR